MKAMSVSMNFWKSCKSSLIRFRVVKQAVRSNSHITYCISNAMIESTHGIWLTAARRIKIVKARLKEMK